MELCSMLSGSLDGRKVWGTCVCMAVSFRCSSETITTLFVNQLYPNTNKKFKKKKRLHVDTLPLAGTKALHPSEKRLRKEG